MSDLLVPSELHYTADHLWAVATDGGRFRVGITDYAQDALGDVISVQLPQVGAHFEAGEVFGVVESLKADSELYAPITGTVAATNEALAESPELVNDEPYGGGWMCEVTPRASTPLETLLDAVAYTRLTSDE